MAVHNPVPFLQAGSHDAEGVRRMLRALAGGIPGVAGPLAGGIAELEVTETATPSMSVDVAAGAAWVEGSEASFQGFYFADSRGVTNLAVAASDPANARIDLVIVRVQDAEYSGAVSQGSIEAVTGIAAPTPVEPSPPPNSEVLARVDVGAAATSVTNADITDRRRPGGLRRRVRGLISGTTDGAGDFTVTHGLGVIPAHIDIQEVDPGGVSAWTNTRVVGKTATTFTARILGIDASVLSNTAISGTWEAIA